MLSCRYLGLMCNTRLGPASAQLSSDSKLAPSQSCRNTSRTEYSCTESDHRHHGEERQSSFQLNYLIYGLSACWFGIQGPVPSTRAQSLTIGTMARKGRAPFN